MINYCNPSLCFVLSCTMTRKYRKSAGETTHIQHKIIIVRTICFKFRALAVTSLAKKTGYQLLLTLLGKTDRLKSTTGISELCPPLLNPMSLKLSFFHLDQISIQITLLKDFLSRPKLVIIP